MKALPDKPTKKITELEGSGKGYLNHKLYSMKQHLLLAWPMLI
jgi:hypothetical protein